MLTAVSIDWLNRELIVRKVVATRSTEGNGRRGSQRVCGYLNGDGATHVTCNQGGAEVHDQGGSHAGGYETRGDLTLRLAAESQPQKSEQGKDDVGAR